VTKRRVILCSILAGLAPLLVGCGKKNGMERLPVHGTVTFPNGEKPTCSITFRPAKAPPGAAPRPSATTNVVEGSYKFDRSFGPMAGSYIVSVTRIVSRSDTQKAIADKTTIPSTQTQWTKSVDVLDDGRYVQDFDLRE
jgi:hypothetical protein